MPQPIAMQTSAMKTSVRNSVSPCMEPMPARQRLHDGAEHLGGLRGRLRHDEGDAEPGTGERDDAHDDADRRGCRADRERIASAHVERVPQILQRQAVPRVQEATTMQAVMPVKAARYGV